MLNEKQRKRAFNTIMVTQCLGMLTAAFFQNGFYLNYFTKLGISSASIAFLFALPALLGALLMIPFAFLADRRGKLKLALVGQVMIISSMVLVMAAGWGDLKRAMLWVIGAIILFSVGGSLQGASWFALLNPIVPAEIRGRFFGRLRVTFQTVTILFSLLITKALGYSQQMAVFQGILILVLVAHSARYFTYSRIPELEKDHHELENRHSFAEAFVSVFKVSGFASFNGYVFLITLFTAGVPIVFGLMQKDVFGFSPAQITFMGTLFLGGSVAGNLVGGRLVDHYGTRAVFLWAHVCCAVVILMMIGRHWAPWSLVWHVGLCAFLFSLVEAVRGIAVTSEMMALIPAVNKSLSTSISMSLFSLGVALSGLFVSRSISWNILREKWVMLGQEFSAYDSLLMAFATMVLILLVTIGLVPKVVKTVQLLPGSGYPRM